MFLSGIRTPINHANDDSKNRERFRDEISIRTPSAGFHAAHNFPEVLAQGFCQGMGGDNRRIPFAFFQMVNHGAADA